MIVCLRTVVVPPEWHERYLAWITEGRAIRQHHGILAELVCEPATPDGETVVITVWPSHEVFEACLPALRGSRPRSHSVADRPALGWL